MKYGQEFYAPTDGSTWFDESNRAITVTNLTMDENTNIFVNFVGNANEQALRLEVWFSIYEGRVCSNELLEAQILVEDFIHHEFSSEQVEALLQINYAVEDYLSAVYTKQGIWEEPGLDSTFNGVQRSRQMLALRRAKLQLAYLLADYKKISA